MYGNKARNVISVSLPFWVLRCVLFRPRISDRFRTTLEDLLGAGADLADSARESEEIVRDSDINGDTASSWCDA